MNDETMIAAISPSGRTKEKDACVFYYEEKRQVRKGFDAVGKGLKSAVQWTEIREEIERRRE